MNLPANTQQIFDHLRQGLFLSANAVQPAEAEMYQAVLRHEESLRDYFEPLGLQLKRGTGYFYLAQQQSEAKVREQVDKMGRWFDGYFFLKSWNLTLGPRDLLEVPALVADIEQRPPLRKLLRELTIKGNPPQTEARLIAFLRSWERGSMIQQVREAPLTYEVMNAFSFLDELVKSIPSR